MLNRVLPGDVVYFMWAFMCTEWSRYHQGTERRVKRKGTSENGCPWHEEKLFFTLRLSFWLHVPQLSTVVLSPFSLPPRIVEQQKAIQYHIHVRLVQCSAAKPCGQKSAREMLECSVRRSVLAPKTHALANPTAAWCNGGPRHSASPHAIPAPAPVPFSFS